MTPTNKSRAPANTMKVGAAIVAAWIAYEGFSSTPIIPTKGDVPTIGHGSTFYEDGTRVKMSDPPITRKRAEELATELLDQEFGKCVRASLGGTLVNPTEFVQAVDFAGNFGCANWGQSSMLKKTRAGDYAGECQSYLLYKYAAGYDCSTPGNKRCSGLWTRQLERHAKCMASQTPVLEMLAAAPAPVAVVVEARPAPPPPVAIPPKRWWSWK